MKLLNGGSQKKRMNNLSNHKIIPYPKKKVLTTFYFVSGEKLTTVTADNCNIDKKNNSIAHQICSSYFVQFANCIVSTNHITHVTFEYEDEDEDKDEDKDEDPKGKTPSIKDIFRVISKILSFILLCMTFVYVGVCLCILFKK